MGRVAPVLSSRGAIRVGARAVVLIKYARVLFAIVSLLASLVIAEALTRWLLPRPGFVAIPDRPSIVPHPTRGYSYAPNHAGFTNEWGLRDEPIASGERVDVLAVGDSFTVGGGLEPGDAWPRQLETLIDAASPAGVRVLNAGVAAYSLAQIRDHTHELAARFDPDIIVLGLLTSRYWRLHDPYVFFHGVAVRRSTVRNTRVIDGGLVYTPFRWRWLQSLEFFLGEHFYFGAHVLRAADDVVQKAKGRMSEEPRPLTRSEIEFRLTPLLKELERIHRLALASHRQLVVLLINEQERDGSFAPVEREYNEVVESFCSRSRIEVLDPLPAFENAAEGEPVLRQGEDHHWSKQAHTLAARELFSFLSREGLLRQLTDERGP